MQLNEESKLNKPINADCILGIQKTKTESKLLNKKTTKRADIKVLQNQSISHVSLTLLRIELLWEKDFSSFSLFFLTTSTFALSSSLFWKC